MGSSRQHSGVVARMLPFRFDDFDAELLLLVLFHPAP